ncbi:hypothetical protein [Streptomyces indicus]|uniref:Uncharacterized protein n=1 Tax=Streptomyces indicus TaxID=417292 RepID=A0A1G8TLH8_9ACTN|nr:hypothetical protein [Streptomyces indicus]SDJ41745.1 hypothetical protein SAMN05421806_101309 [Streptomyces indicus]
MGELHPVLRRIGRLFQPDGREPGESAPAAPAGRKAAERSAADDRRRTHNIFEAAATYVTACVDDDQEKADEAAGWVQPEALHFGINELACRAVIALARERDEPPGEVARSLLGLPAA